VLLNWRWTLGYIAVVLTALLAVNVLEVWLR
jgi:hypothetical protein